MSNHYAEHLKLTQYCVSTAIEKFFRIFLKQKWLRKALVQQWKAGFTYQFPSAAINTRGFMAAIKLSKQEHNHFCPGIRAHFGASYSCTATSESPLLPPSMDF